MQERKKQNSKKKQKEKKPFCGQSRRRLLKGAVSLLLVLALLTGTIAVFRTGSAGREKDEISREVEPTGNAEEGQPGENIHVKPIVEETPEAGGLTGSDTNTVSEGDGTGKDKTEDDGTEPEAFVDVTDGAEPEKESGVVGVTIIDSGKSENEVFSNDMEEDKAVVQQEVEDE